MGDPASRSAAVAGKVQHGENIDETRIEANIKLCAEPLHAHRRVFHEVFVAQDR